MHTGRMSSPAHLRPGIDTVTVFHGDKSPTGPGDVVLAEKETHGTNTLIQNKTSQMFSSAMIPYLTIVCVRRRVVAKRPSGKLIGGVMTNVTNLRDFAIV